jgi:ABC-2 type transport system permease protein
MIINQDKIRWLFWLRWKIFTRGFGGRGSARVLRIIGSIVLLLAILVISVGIAVGAFFACRLLPAPANIAVLFLILTGIFVLWLILPILEFSTNEGLDISKLALFPLTRGELMTSLVISTLLDIPTIGLILVLGAIVAAWATSIPLALLALLAMLIFYVQLVAVSQLVLALVQKVLQSRRFRDISVILVVLLSSSGYICQLVARTMINQNFIDNLKSATFVSYLQWLPPGMAARAIQQANDGNWGLSFIWLFALAIITLCFLFFWQMIVERGLTTAESNGSAKTKRQRKTATAAETIAEADAASNTLIARLLPVPIRAMLVKDLKYFWRDPQIKAIFIQSLVSMTFLTVYFSFTLFNNNNGTQALSGLGNWIVPIVPIFLLFTLYSLAYNSLGFERQGITTLFLFPIDPRYILWGKNIAVMLVGVVEILILVTAASIITHGWQYTGPALVIGLAGLGIILGIGNFTTVFLPQKMRMARRGFQTRTNMTAEGGCLRIVMSMVATLLMLILLIPVAAAVFVPILLHVQWIWIISLPVSIIYGILFYTIVTNAVAPRILQRAPEIVAVIAKE